ncbi:hypothetical protein [Phorcysia thermohydrogeniphila]|uniref:Uncharacterized protein n=1 Tax=Phorcysia thermohydrogeniphila TaxID=936138 RepID=A0A4R1G8T4_9BACT|nr:hypothetical protein [Phorcysia thermohydrogeniphila]TCK04028.1 hypothetical protein CLV27_1345 [Phorcysia thermohydrogeniphila]
MKGLLHLLILVFTFFSSAVYAENTPPSWCYDRKVVIAYVNGMQVGRVEAEQSLEFLNRYVIRKAYSRLRNFLSENFFAEYEVALLYNYHVGKIDDIVEAYIQLVQEKGMSFEEARETVHLWIMAFQGILQDFSNNAIVSFYLELFSSYLKKRADELLTQNLNTLIRNYQEHREVLQDWLNKGYPILLIPHSQGNFFVNAYAQNNWLTPTDPNAPPPVVKVLHLATPATKTAFENPSESPYYTLEEDLVIAKLVSAAAEHLLNISILPPNTKLACGNTLECIYKLKDFTLHSFTKTYLNPKYPASLSMRNLVLNTVVSFTQTQIEKWYENLIGNVDAEFYEFEKLSLNNRCPICGIDPTSITDRQIDPPRVENLDCSSQTSITASGGYQVTTIIVDVSKVGNNRTLNFYFEPYYVPDSICISHPPGNEIYKRIRIGRNEGTPDLPVIDNFVVNSFFGKDPLKSKVVIIIVGEEPSTAWDFELSCN